jgi:murein L,D-transpeptidase YafK
MTTRSRRKALARSVLLSSVFLTAPSAPALEDRFSSPLARAGAPYVLEVRKAERRLRVHDGRRTVAVFDVATGRGGRGDKERRGDQRTPVGTYHVVDFNEASRFHLFMQLDYPNVKDAFLAVRRSLIELPLFERIASAHAAGRLPPQDTPLGGQIGLHGLGDEENREKLDLHRRLDWTEGCIALTNQGIRKLRQYVTVGTRVEIHD